MRRDLQQLFNRLEQGHRARTGLWPVRPSFGPRFGPDPDPNAGGGVNLEDPAVKAAIAAQVTARTKALEDEKQRHFTGKTEAETARQQLEDKLKALGVPLDQIPDRLRKLEEIETKSKAEAAGGDPERFKAAVEAEAQAKFSAWKVQEEGVHKKATDRVAELERTVEQLKVDRHRMFVARELALAAVPPEARIVHEGAYDHLIDSLAPVMVEHLPPGAKIPIARFKDPAGTFLPGSGADGYMTREEMLAQLRLGKGPVQGLDYCFVSKGEGSATTTATQQASSPTGKKWEDLDAAEKTKFINEHTDAEVRAAQEAARQRARDERERQRRKPAA